jgi:NTE family protein
VLSVDLRKREEVVLQSGFVTPALVAAMAVPGLFPPVRLDGRTLVDGGLLNPLPTSTVTAAGADVVIAIKLTSASEVVGHAPVSRGWRTRLMPPIVDTIQQAFELMQWRVIAQGHDAGEITIEPQFTGPAGVRDYQRGAEFIAFGREAAAAARDRIQHHLPWVT